MTSLLNEIQEQPEALRRTVDAVGASLDLLRPWTERLQEGKIKRVVMTGMGSSCFAIYPALTYLVEHGIQAIGIETSELLYYYLPLLDEQTLLVIISQSGRSVEVVRLIEQFAGRVSIVGVTNDLASPLARGSSLALYLNAGTELTVSTKSYTCTLAALHLAARALCGMPTEPAAAELVQVADGIGRMMPAWDRQMDAVAAQLAPHPDDIRFVVYLGRGPSRASAMTSALITKETAKLPTEGMVGGQFRHGPIEVLSPGVMTVIFAGPGRTRDLDLALAADLAEREGRVMVVGSVDQARPGTFVVDVPSVNEWTAPVAEIVPIQFLAAKLAQRRGVELGKFRFIQKVTTTE
jgi:glutamine---fructose-6-phosphate transaminase (isomerizing)